MVLSVGKINLFGKELATHNDNKVRLFDIFFVNYLLWSFIGIPVQILVGNTSNLFSSVSRNIDAVQVVQRC